MKPLILVYQALVRWVIQAWRLPRTLTNAARLRRQRHLAEVLEAERIDRIRNPWKYLGK